MSAFLPATLIASVLAFRLVPCFLRIWRVREILNRGGQTQCRKHVFSFAKDQEDHTDLEMIPWREDCARSNVAR